MSRFYGCQSLMINYIYCNIALSVTYISKIMAFSRHPCIFYDFNAVYYIFVSPLLIVNHLLYVFNGPISTYIITREGFCSMGFILMFIDVG